MSLVFVGGFDGEEEDNQRASRAGIPLGEGVGLVVVRRVVRSWVVLVLSIEMTWGEEGDERILGSLRLMRDRRGDATQGLRWVKLGVRGVWLSCLGLNCGFNE